MTFCPKVTIIEVENFREFNLNMCHDAMSGYSENLEYKRYLGPLAFKRQCTLPNSAYNTFINSQNFIK